MKVRADRKVIREPLVKVVIELNPDESVELSNFLGAYANYMYTPPGFLTDLRDKLYTIHEKEE